jgi:hypothetical protein
VLLLLLPSFTATVTALSEQTQVKLRAEANILSRANERLKAEKATDAARVSALQQEVRALHQQLTDAGSVADKLRAELGERDGVINDNHVSLQGLKRRVQELETHKVCGAGHLSRLTVWCVSSAKHSKQFTWYCWFQWCLLHAAYDAYIGAGACRCNAQNQQLIVQSQGNDKCC